MKSFGPLIGQCPRIAVVRDQLRRLTERLSSSARLPPILLCGETGTGKGLLARAIHDSSGRAGGPFVDVDCAAIPETLIESELFGHERGAFTDARQTKIGLFEAADGGTLFMDEIGLLPKGPQAKLLKAVEERAVRKLGATRGKLVDVLIVAATNEELSAAVREGRFREDLYHRLTPLTFVLPPLRERGDDVILLAEHFLSIACDRHGVAAKHLTSDARMPLLAYRWPGNVRELANVMERLALLSDERAISAEHIRLPGGDFERSSLPSKHGTAQLRESISNLERARLLEALAGAEGNVTLAAERLGLPRNTLRYRMARLGLLATADSTSSLHRRRRRRAPEDESKRASKAPLIEWEHRLLAMVHARIALPPGNEFSARVSRTVASCIEQVRGFGGEIEQRGDGWFVAVFGLHPAEDALERAALSALALVRPSARKGQRDVWEVSAIIHIDNVRVSGSGQGALIHSEDMPGVQKVFDDLAALAAPGAVVTSMAAAPFLRRRFELHAPGEGIRGLRIEAVEARLTEISGRVLSPLQGRDRELVFLSATVEQIIAGRGQVIGITGEPGVGKSRLLCEFQRRLDSGRVRYLEERCRSFASAVPYLPLVDLLRAYCGIAESDPPDATVSKLRSVLAAAGLTEAVPYLLHLLGLGEVPEDRGSPRCDDIEARMFDALRRLLLAGTGGDALILAIEDLHWIDRTSEQFLMTLAAGIASTPVLMLTTYRAGYHPPWIGRSFATQIALAPLTPAESRLLLQSLTVRKPVPNVLAQGILEKAEGNPFFLEELTRSIEGDAADDPGAGMPEMSAGAMSSSRERPEHRAE